MNNRFFESGEIRVKICGITREQDARDTISAGADALGFNFWPRSKRYLVFEEANLLWIRKLTRVTRIAVVVNAEAAFIQALRDSGCFEAIQFHGDETPVFCEAFELPHWIRAVAVQEPNREVPARFATTDFLLDAPTPEYGGSGKTVDWVQASQWVTAFPDRRFLLAGGLTPDNVAAAVQAVGPHGVDVASGVEKSPGIKDADKVRKFISEAKCGTPSY